MGRGSDGMVAGEGRKVVVQQTRSGCGLCHRSDPPPPRRGQLQPGERDWGLLLRWEKAMMGLIPWTHRTLVCPFRPRVFGDSTGGVWKEGMSKILDQRLGRPSAGSE